ncbi:MAG: substrate-binding domain-containing protein [Bacteroidia bacterium]|nr:substrate-binding domain-containing protein [Bacteroidia bacterium]
MTIRIDTMKISILIFAIASFAVGSLVSCNSSGNKDPEKEVPLDNMTKGEITIGADENYRPLVEAELSAFHNIYDQAKINVVFRPEAQAFDDLINERVRLIVASRELNEDEKAYFAQKKIFPDVNAIGTSGIGILVNKANQDSLLSRAQLKSILAGQTDTWKKLNPASGIMENQGKITIVVDHPGSGSLRFLMEDFMGGGSIPANLFSAGSNQDVIDYVGDHPGAIGVIGLNWISDQDEALVDSALSRVILVGMEAEDSSGNGIGKFYKPYQSYLADKSYILRREILTISIEGRAGLGTGFVAFAAGEKGQRVVLKTGLVPKIMPPRLVKFPSVENATDIDDYIKENAKDDEN